MNRSTKLKLAAAFMAAVSLAGCGVNPVSTQPTENPDVAYSVLFNRNGCEVGRFYDYGRPVYITTCPSAGTSAAQWSHTESCGKNCTTTITDTQNQTRVDLSGPSMMRR
jgi:hypothetical protein